MSSMFFSFFSHLILFDLTNPASFFPSSYLSNLLSFPLAHLLFFFLKSPHPPLFEFELENFLSLSKLFSGLLELLSFIFFSTDFFSIGFFLERGVSLLVSSRLTTRTFTFGFDGSISDFFSS
jgi:hypothetical protein